jgi:hypothetical protein
LISRKYGAGNFLSRWAAAGGPSTKTPDEEEEVERLEGLAGFREGVVWYLRRGLQSAAESQRRMVEIRVKRAEERERSALYKMKGAPVSNMGNGAAWDEKSMNGSAGIPSIRGAYDPAMDLESKSIESQLSPEQLQLFAEENNIMLQHYEDQRSKVKFVPHHTLPSPLRLPCPH